MKHNRQEMDDATLRLNLWMTQALVLAVSAGSSLLVHGWSFTLALFKAPDWTSMLWAGCVAFIVVSISIAMERFLPRTWQDDGSVNERIFGSMSPLMTVLVCAVVGIGEEWLFRGVIQPLAGIWWTSAIFTLVHVRYLKKPLLIVSVFLTSWLLGMLFDLRGSLWPPIAAHILIDLVLAFYLQYTIKQGKGEKE